MATQTTPKLTPEELAMLKNPFLIDFVDFDALKRRGINIRKTIIPHEFACGYYQVKGKDDKPYLITTGDKVTVRGGKYRIHAIRQTPKKCEMRLTKDKSPNPEDKKEEEEKKKEESKKGDIHEFYRTLEVATTDLIEDHESGKDTSLEMVECYVAGKKVISWVDGIPFIATISKCNTSYGLLLSYSSAFKGYQNECQRWYPFDLKHCFTPIIDEGKNNLKPKSMMKKYPVLMYKAKVNEFRASIKMIARTFMLDADKMQHWDVINLYLWNCFENPMIQTLNNNGKDDNSHKLCPWWSRTDDGKLSIHTRIIIDLVENGYIPSHFITERAEVLKAYPKLKHEYFILTQLSKFVQQVEEKAK